MAVDLDNLTDENLAQIVQESVKNKSHEAFAILVARYEKKMERYANKFLYTYEDRQDALQDVFLKAYQNIQSFRTQDKFSPWIYRVAHNTFINVIKKQKREKVSYFDTDQLFAWNIPDESIKDRETQNYEREILNQSLSEISAKYREPLVLFYFEQKDYKEISDILHMPVATVGVRLRRGREIMRSVYNKLNN